MYKMLNQIESTADLGRVLFIDFMTSPQARSSARDDKKERAVARRERSLKERAVAEGSILPTTALSIGNGPLFTTTLGFAR
jgi:hypothetical protein